MGVRQRPGGTARSRRRKEGGRGGLWGYVLGALGRAAIALPCEMPWPDVKFITEHKEHLQKMAGLGCQ